MTRHILTTAAIALVAAFAAGCSGGGSHGSGAALGGYPLSYTNQTSGPPAPPPNPNLGVGTGPASATGTPPIGVVEPRGIALGGGATFYSASLASTGAPVVLRSSPDSGVSVLATGGAPGTSGTLQEPLALASGKGTVFVADMAASIDANASGAIFAVSAKDGTVSVVQAGAIDVPTGLAASFDGNTLYACGFDPNDGKPAVFSIDAGSGTTTTLFKGSPLTQPTGIGLSNDGTTLFVADARSGPTQNAQVYALPTFGGKLTALATGGLLDSTEAGSGVLQAADGKVVVSTRQGGTGKLSNVPAAGGAATTRAGSPPLSSPNGLATDGNSIFVADGDARGTGAILQVP